MAAKDGEERMIHQTYNQVHVILSYLFRLFSNFFWYYSLYWCTTFAYKLVGFYRAMHYSAKRGIAIMCMSSVRLSVTLVDQDHIGIGN